MEKIKSIKGTHDLLPAESYQWQFVENAIRTVCARYGYREIRTPIFENTALFKRGIGELTDVVSKEMYTFTDQGGNSLTLRPEMTASVMRSYLQHNLGMEGGVQKLYYIGPMFRAENVQKGRLRQFHQWGIESVGASSPLADVEVILVLMDTFQLLGIKNLGLKINSVGDENCRPQYKVALQDFLRPKLNNLCQTCQTRFDKNVLRILDCKNPSCKTIVSTAPKITDYLDETCKTHYQTILSTLKKLGIPYEEDPFLVRGLDYYTKTTFEIVSTDLGSQNAVGGAGRYDLLLEQLGGTKTPAVGFAVGIERLLIIMQEQNVLDTIPVSHPDLFIGAFSESHLISMLPLIRNLRQGGFSIEHELLGRSIKAQMREADRLKAKFSIIIGDNELASQTVKIKNMQNSNQTEITFDQLLHFLKENS